MNEFDQFDTKAGNPFDQFDAAAPVQQPSGLQAKDALFAPDAMLSLGTGAIAAPLAGLAGLASQATHAMGLTKQNPETTVENVQNALTYQPRTQVGQDVLGLINKPFEKLAQGGDYLGQKAADATGSPAIGAAVNTAVQAAPMLVTHKAAPYIKGAVENTKAALAGEQSANVVSDAAKANIQKAGYVVPPSMLESTPVRNAMETVVGKDQLKHEAIVKNQETTNNLAKKGLGISADEPLSDANIKYHRDLAGQDYEAVKQFNQPLITNPEYRGTINNLNTTKSLVRDSTIVKDLKAKLNPGHNFSMTTDEAISTVKDLRSKATENLKAQGDPAKIELGKAQRQAADAIDQLVDDNLSQRFGNTDLVRKYREARQYIAKSHDVQAALNEQTGNVDASHFANLLKKDRPLTGPLRDIGEFGRIYPQIAKMPEKTATPRVSLGDLASIGVSGALKHAVQLPYMMLRPDARRIILSRALQKGLQTPDYSAGVTTNMGAALGSPYAAPAIGSQQTLIDALRQRTQ